MTRPTDELLNEATDRAFEALERALGDLEVEFAFITFGLKGEQPNGKKLGGTAGIGFDHPADLLSFLLAQAQGIAERGGMDLHIVTPPFIGSDD
jgi:hypothetical protein